MTWQEDLGLALRDAFELEEFDRVVARISRRRTDYSADRPMPEVARAVILAADSGGWIRELVASALWIKSGNSLLQRFRDDNPFAAPTRLKAPEADQIAAAIQNAFPSYQDLSSVIAAPAKETLDVIVNRTLDPPADTSARLVTWFDDRGAARKLIEVCVAARPHEPVLIAASKTVLSAIKAREVAAGYRTQDPYDTCLIDQQVFIDRAPLRAALRGWLPPPRKRVVAVKGPTRSGKTYSLQLVQHIAARTKMIQVASIDLTDENLSLFLPSTLARRVMLQMGRASDRTSTPSEEEAGSGARLARELCDWLVGTARESATTWVIVLDGSHLGNVREETRDMIRELVKRASAPDAPLRVVLLGYTEDLIPINLRKRVAEEELGAPSAKDVRDWLDKLVDQLGVEVEDGAIDELMAGVIQKTALQSIEAVAAEIQAYVDDLQGATT